MALPQWLQDLGTGVIKYGNSLNQPSSPFSDPSSMIIEERPRNVLWSWLQQMRGQDTESASGDPRALIAQSQKATAPPAQYEALQQILHPLSPDDKLRRLRATLGGPTAAESTTGPTLFDNPLNAGIPGATYTATGTAHPDAPTQPPAIPPPPPSASWDESSYLNRASQLGGQIIPPATTVADAMFPNTFTNHPRLRGLLEGAAITAASLDPTGPYANVMNYRTNLAQSASVLPGQRLQEGLKTVGTLDAARRAQMVEDQAAQLFPEQLAQTRAKTEADRALAEQRLRPAIPAGSDFDAYIARLEADEGRPLTGPEMLEARKVWLEQGGSSQGLPFSVQEYEYYANQARARGEEPMPIEQYKTLAANTYMQGRYIPTMNQQTGQVGAVFPNAPGRSFEAPAGVTTPTFAGRIAEAQAAFESTDAMLNQIEEQANKLITAEGTWDAAKQYGQGIAAGLPVLRTQFPEAAIYKDTTAAFGSMLTRAAGERGVLTQQDVQRILNALPRFDDTKDMAENKLQRLRGLYRAVVQGVNAAYASGEMPTPEDFTTAGIGEGGIIRDPDTGRRWVLQYGTPRPIILTGE